MHRNWPQGFYPSPFDGLTPFTIRPSAKRLGISHFRLSVELCANGVTQLRNPLTLQQPYSTEQAALDCISASNTRFGREEFAGARIATLKAARTAALPSS
jgi:hypothetical protein